MQGRKPGFVELGPPVSLITLENAERSYQVGENTVKALGPVSLSLEQGEFVVILGPSGSGKTTLLNLIAGIDRPSSGSCEVAGRDLTQLDRAGLLEYRRQHVGVVFQAFNLIPNLTARENVEIVAELTGTHLDVVEVLDSVGLGHRLDHFPHEMSGGEQQRVAIARALVKNPTIVLGDEPTGNLDLATSKKVLEVFQRVHQQGKCVILVTHHVALTELATRVVHISDGAIKQDLKKEAGSLDRLDW